MSVLVLSVILCCIALAVWSWVTPRHPLPPTYPGALPLIGNAHQLFGDHKYLWKLIQNVVNYCIENGGVIKFWIGPHILCYVLTDPDDIAVVSNACLDKPYIYMFAKEFVNNGLITAEVPTWKTHRKLLNPAFNQQVLNTFLNVINVQARDLVSELASEVGKDSFEVQQYFIRFTLKTINRTTLGLQEQDQTMIDIDYVQVFEDYIALLIERIQKWWLHLSLLFKWSVLKRKQDELLNTIKRIINPVIQKRKSDLELMRYRGKHNESTPDKFKPVLDHMLDLAHEQDAFTNDDIREHLSTFVVAAYDTTSAVMTYILLLIGSHRDVQERIYAELQEVLDHKDEDITKDHLPKLVYLEAVIKETLRLYPPVPIIARHIDKDVKLKNYTMRAGYSCFLGLFAVNRHPMWGTDADQFRPERWLDPASLPGNANAFASFGVGKRNCIGKLYSMMVIKTALAHILRRYHVTSDITKLEFKFEVVLKPVAGHLITLKLRT